MHRICRSPGAAPVWGAKAPREVEPEAPETREPARAEVRARPSERVPEAREARAASHRVRRKTVAAEEAADDSPPTKARRSRNAAATEATSARARKAGSHRLAAEHRVQTSSPMAIR